MNMHSPPLAYLLGELTILAVLVGGRLVGMALGRRAARWL